MLPKLEQTMLMWIRGAAALFAAIVFAAGTSSAAPIVVDFEGDALGNVPNGFTSVASPDIAFSDTDGGANLLIGSDAFITGGSQALAAFFAGDGGGLRIDLSFVASEISLDFGNDGFGSGDFELVAYLGGVQVGVGSVVPNLNLVVDQTILFDASDFDAVVLRYTGALGATEIIDNVMVTSAEVIPEPSGALLFGVGALVLRATMRSGRSAPAANGAVGSRT